MWPALPFAWRAWGGEHCGAPMTYLMPAGRPSLQAVSENRHTNSECLTARNHHASIHQTAEPGERLSRPQAQGRAEAQAPTMAARSRGPT